MYQVKTGMIWLVDGSARSENQFKQANEFGRFLMAAIERKSQKEGRQTCQFLMAGEWAEFGLTSPFSELIPRGYNPAVVLARHFQEEVCSVYADEDGDVWVTMEDPYRRISMSLRLYLIDEHHELAECPDWEEIDATRFIEELRPLRIEDVPGFYARSSSEAGMFW